MDPGEFLQTLPPSLRQSLLADMEESQISALPAELAAEAQNLRRDYEQVFQAQPIQTICFTCPHSAEQPADDAREVLQPCQPQRRTHSFLHPQKHGQYLCIEKAAETLNIFNPGQPTWFTLRHPLWFWNRGPQQLVAQHWQREWRRLSQQCNGENIVKTFEFFRFKTIIFKPR